MAVGGGASSSGLLPTAVSPPQQHEFSASPSSRSFRPIFGEVERLCNSASYSSPTRSLEQDDLFDSRRSSRFSSPHCHAPQRESIPKATTSRKGVADLSTNCSNFFSSTPSTTGKGEMTRQLSRGSHLLPPSAIPLPQLHGTPRTKLSEMRKLSAAPAARSVLARCGGSTSTRSSVRRAPSRRDGARKGMRAAAKHPIITLLVVLATALFPLDLFRGAEATGASPNPCAHENDERMGTPVEMCDGCSTYTDLGMNQSHRYFFNTQNTTLMHQPDEFRKLIVHLEPCKGVVYLFVHKTRRCYPNPYSCIDLSQAQATPLSCAWTHYQSVIDGTRDGAPTFYEFPLTSTRYYVTVFAKERSSYQITFLSDIGAYPRPGNQGRVTASQLSELQVGLSWNAAQFSPQGITNVRRYWVYSALLRPIDEPTNSAVFIGKDKIMNTVCGLINNTDVPSSAPIPASRCSAQGVCNATIDGVTTGQKYIFNIVAESERGFKMAYSGLILTTQYTVVKAAASAETLKVVGAVIGSILGILIIMYVWMLNLYKS